MLSVDRRHHLRQPHQGGIAAQHASRRVVSAHAIQTAPAASANDACRDAVSTEILSLSAWAPGVRPAVVAELRCVLRPSQRASTYFTSSGRGLGYLGETRLP